MRVLVVTGGIGAGKSTVCSLLAERGVPVYDSDSRAKALYDEDLSLRERVSALFGEEIYGSDGHIDRKKLSGIVFGDTGALERLEALVHPAVFRDFARWKDAMARYPLVAYESAIALEKGLPQGFADAVVYVDAPLELRLERAAARDGLPPEAVLAKASAQCSSASDPAVDYVLMNGAGLSELSLELDNLLDSLHKRWSIDFAANPK